jgi:hypothetical protein
VRRRDLRRHGAVRAQQGAAVAPVPAPAGRRPEPRHLLRGSSGCSIRWRSRPASPAIWRPCRSGCKAWSPSTARRCAARSTARRAKHPCTWLAPGRASSAWCWASCGSRASRTRSRRCRSCSRCWRWTAASSLPMRCTARTRPPSPSWSVAAIMCSRSRPTGRRCSRTCDCSSTTQRRRRTRSPPPPTATTAASRPAAPRSSTTSPGWPRAMAFPASRRSARSPRRASRTARPPPRPATTCSPGRFPRRSSSRWCAPTGRSRTGCTGCSTWSSTRTLARARKGHAPESLARLRRFALNVLRTNREMGSTRGKIKRAGWDDDFLLQLLATA